MDKLKCQVLTALIREFPHCSFAYDKLEVMHKGRFANAIVFRYREAVPNLVIKDYSHCPWLIRRIAGRFFINRETKALERLNGIEGVPSRSYRLNPLMLAYPFIEGESLRSLRKTRKKLPREFFESFEKLVARMHRRGIVHLDLRNLGNVLLGEDGKPYIIDFQSSLRFVPFLPRIQRIMRSTDLSGVYKAWKILCDEPLPERKENFSNNFAEVRKLWVFRGYPLKRGTKLVKRLATRAFRVSSSRLDSAPDRQMVADICGNSPIQ